MKIFRKKNFGRGVARACIVSCPTTHRPSDAYGDFALAVNCSGARTSAWHDKLTQCWLMLIRMSGWSASAETPHLILGSGKRPDIRAKIGDKEVLFDVRTKSLFYGDSPNHQERQLNGMVTSRAGSPKPSSDTSRCS